MKSLLRPTVAASLLLAFALIPAALHAQAAKRVLATERGAVGDGQTVNTKALQAAIDRLATEGGGTLVVPKGTFISCSHR